jgi:polar amino acid transport system permease protein
MTMVIVTHEINFAFRISDRIIFLENRSIVADAAPRVMTRSKDSRVAHFLKDLQIAWPDPVP